MDWINQLNEAINYIEENLTGEISYDTISQIVGCSVYNFQRMFSYIADKPLSEYIRNRRLTLAAFDILNSTDRIIDISFKYGYESQDSFSRAFRSFHGVLPSVVRNETVQLKSCPKLSFQITIKGENHMNYQIVQFPAFKVVGITNRVNTLEAFKIVPQIWENAWKDGTMNSFIELFKKSDYRPAGFLGMCAGGKWGNSEEIDVQFKVIGGLSRINSNSPYSKENPIRIIDGINYLRQFQNGCCGQTCLAMLAGISVDEVIKIMKSTKWQASISKVIETLDYFGFLHKKPIYTKGRRVNLPKCCIINVRGKNKSHLMVCYEGKYYDSSSGILQEYEFENMISYIEIST